MKTFKELGLSSNGLKSLEDLGFVEPSLIQEKVIPFILESKKDLIALAQTGTGKTAAFGLPLLEKIKKDSNELQAIILCPTRELCLQITQDLEKYAKHSKGVSITPVYGGSNIVLQIKSLKRGTNIVVGTPGRVHDLIRRKDLNLKTIKWLVLDEADEMLDMGFKDDLDAILDQIPKTRQTLLFSATMSKKVESIAKKYMNEAFEISVGAKNVGSEQVSHEYYIVQAKDRFEALKRILDSLPDFYGILFCRTRRETQDIAEKLKYFNYDAEALHGEISQNLRTKIMDRFKKKQVRLLVATDVAARGIDVSDLTHVINYNLPDQNEAYTHRSGRTGRAKKTGVSISIITPRDSRRIKAIEGIIGKNFEYKKVPSKQDICQTRIDKFIQELEANETKELNENQIYKDITAKLSKVKKDDLISFFINKQFSEFLSNNGSGDLNAEAAKEYSRVSDRDSISLKINLGRSQGFDIKALFSLINASNSLKNIDIGRIDLFNDYSLFAVSKNFSEQVLNQLNGKKFKGKKIVVNISQEKVSSSRKSSRRGHSRNSARYKNKRRNFKRNR